MLWYFHFLFPQNCHRFMCQFLKSNPSKQQSSQDLVHYLTKNRCSLSSQRKEENTGLSIIVLLVSFAQISFPAWPAYDILCLSALISSFVCVYTSLTCSLLDTTQLTVYSIYATSSFRFWCFRLTFWTEIFKLAVRLPDERSF